MKKLKLMFLGMLLLASQVNGLLVKFSDRPEVEIDDKYGEIFVPLEEGARLNSLRESLIVRISSADFAMVKEVLLKARLLDIPLHTGTLTEEQKEDELLELISDFRDRGPDFIRTLSRVNEILHIHVLRDAIIRLEVAVNDPDPVRVVPVGQCLESRDGVLSQSYDRDVASPDSCAYIRVINEEEAKELVLPAESSARGTKDQPYIIFAKQAKLAEVLKTMLEVSEQGEVLLLPCISIREMNILMPLWDMAFNLVCSGKTVEEVSEARGRVCLAVKALDLEQLNLLLKAVNFLDIKILFEVVTEEFGRRVSSPEFLDLFKNHQERFSVEHEQPFVALALPGLSQEIVRNMPVCSILDGLWELSESVDSEGSVTKRLPDGHIVRDFDDNTAKVWMLNEDGTVSSVEFRGHVKAVSSVAVMLDGRIVTGAEDRTARVSNNITLPWNLTLEQILFINAFKQSSLDLTNSRFKIIFESLDSRIQDELKKLDDARK